MSADPEAILFYGHPLPSLVVDYHELNETWEKAHRPTVPEGDRNYQSPEWDEWRERLRKWERGLENVRIDWSGGEECEQYYVHCAGIKKTVEWNELLVVSEYDLANPFGAKALLHDFCDRFNLPKEEPSWHLAARYF